MVILSIVFVVLMRQGGSGETWIDDEEWEEEVVDQTALVDQSHLQKQYPTPPPVASAAVPVVGQQQPNYPAVEARDVAAPDYSGYVDPYAQTGYQQPPQFPPQ